MWCVIRIGKLLEVAVVVDCNALTTRHADLGQAGAQCALIGDERRTPAVQLCSA